MATIKKPVSFTAPSKQTVITTLTAKKTLKSDTVVKKTSPVAPKITSVISKMPAKPVVSKMASTKISAATVDKATASLKTSPVVAKPVLVKAPVKRVVADSTSCDKEPAAKPIRKLSIPTGLTKSTIKVTTKPVASSDPKLKTSTPDDKVAVAKTKSAILTGKSTAKPAAEKLPAKAKLTSTTLPSKTSSANSTKPVTTNALVKRPLVPKMTDLKKPAVVSKTALTKSASKTVTSVVKPVSIRTPIAAKKVIKQCTEVQICDADSTSSTVNDQLEIELGLELSTATPQETSVEFNVVQAYKVAEQMMEALGTAVVVTDDTIRQDSVLNDSVVIDMSAVEVPSQPAHEELTGASQDQVLEKSTECETAEQVDVCNDSSKDAEEEACIPDLISFSDNTEVCQDEEPTYDELSAETRVEAAEDIAVEGFSDETKTESALDQGEGIEEVSKSDEVPSDEGAAVVDDVNEPKEETTAEEQIIEHCNDDDAQEVENCEKSVDDVELSKEVTSENETENEEKVDDSESYSVEAEVSEEKAITEVPAEVIDEMPSTVDPETPQEDAEDASSPAEESQSEHSEQVQEEVVESAVSIDIKEDHFYAETDPVAANVTLECNSDDFVVVELGDENGAEDLEQVLLVVDDCSTMDAEKSVDTESVASADSAASYADAVKQSTVECAGDFEAIGNVEVDLEVQGDETTVADNENTAADVAAEVNEEEAEGVEADGHVEITEVSRDAEIAEASGDAETCEIAHVEADSVEEQTVKVEPLLGPMADEVQLELDAGMEHSHAVDEEGYEKVLKKRPKRNQKRNRKSLKALQKENTDVEPETQVKESQDDLQIFQKRKNNRRYKNSMKKQYRRNSEPYSNHRCHTTPVWKSFYVEN